MDSATNLPGTGGMIVVGDSTKIGARMQVADSTTGVLIVVHGGMVISIAGNDFGRMKGDLITMIGEILTGKIMVTVSKRRRSLE